MCKKNSNSFILTISRNINELDDFREEFNSFLLNNNVSSDISAQLELSIYEVLINIIEHNMKIPGRNDIFIKSLIESQIFKCHIEYPGEEFDIRSAELPNIDDHFARGESRGLGLYIIRKIMDSIEYQFNEGINILKLTRKI